MGEVGGGMGGTWRQLNLNDSKKNLKKRRKESFFFFNKSKTKKEKLWFSYLASSAFKEKSCRGLTSLPHPQQKFYYFSLTQSLFNNYVLFHCVYKS